MFELREVRMAICPLSGLSCATACFDFPPSPVRTSHVDTLLGEPTRREVFQVSAFELPSTHYQRRTYMHLMPVSVMRFGNWGYFEIFV